MSNSVVLGTVVGQAILAFIALLGFGIQIWRGIQSDRQEQRQFEQQTAEIKGRIELAQLELAAVTAKAHAAADRAYHEANTVNEKIHAVGTGIIKLVKQSDPTEADELARALEAAKDVADKRNGTA